MSKQRQPSAIEQRADNPAALARFCLPHLRPHLPLRFPLQPSLPPSPKPRYRSHYRYLDAEGLHDPQTLETLSAFDLALRLIDYAHLEALLAASLYLPSAKGQVPFHPVSMYLLRVYRRERGLSRRETVRLLKSEEGAHLRRRLGFEDQFPTESGLRYFEKRLTPQLQWEINALLVEMLYQAGLLPTCPDEAHKLTLSFDGMLHQARSRMRCAYVRDPCYRKVPRACHAREEKKQGCDCSAPQCAQVCRYATPRDPEARLVVYSGNNKRAPDSPNASTQDTDKKSSRKRLVYGYYSYAGQILDPALATYWILPAAFAAATTDDRTLFPQNWRALLDRFPWLQVEAVLADAGAGYQCCLDPIWDAHALRLVDIRADKDDKDHKAQLRRGYDHNGYPLCPFGYVCHPNGHDYDRRLTKWRCAKSCLHDKQRSVPACDYLKPQHKHGYTTTVGRAHKDGTVRLAREIPYASPAWKKLYHRRNCAESRNSVQQRLGLKLLPVHGLSRAHSQVLLGDFVANLRTLVRLFRQASSLLPD